MGGARGRSLLDSDSRGGGQCVESFFDSVDHTQLREVLSQRVRDGVLIRLIGKWLKAGVMEEGVVRHPETGTPQGGVISPLLANVYLHEVLDVWWEREVRTATAPGENTAVAL
jgi:RNA-directed DNA polymerase